MKATITAENAAPKSYPCLMGTTNGLVVLFSSYETGTVIVANGPNKIGDHAEDWYMPNFSPFTGTITLEG